MNSHARKIHLITLVLIFSLSVFGCSGSKSLPINEYTRLQTSKIALIQSRSLVQTNLDIHAKDHLEGTIKGALKGLTAGSDLVAGPMELLGECKGFMCAPAAFVYLATVAISTSAGAVYGVVTSPSASHSRSMEENLEARTLDILSQIKLSQMIVQKVSNDSTVNMELIPAEKTKGLSASQINEMLRVEGYQSIIHPYLTTIEFEGGEGNNPVLSLVIKATVEFINLENTESTTRREFEYKSFPATYKEWITKPPISITIDFDTALEEIIDDIHHEYFSNVDLQISSGYYSFPTSKKYGCCWICPENPPFSYSFWKQSMEYPVVESLQPTLKWSIFPDSSQIEKLQVDSGRAVKKTSYDLRILDGVARPVYEVNNIPTNQHTLGITLDPDTIYLWSVRGCFSLEGSSLAYCSKWASSYLNALKGNDCQTDYFSPSNYYRFKTPPE